jgi:ADP-ribose pyrophosphatase YjhB (NUDIX family)
MKVVLIDGVTLSGKTLLATELVKNFSHLKVAHIDESSTFLPFLDNRTENVAYDSLLSLVNKMKELSDNKYDLVFVERFHLSHAVRLGLGADFIKKIESLFTDFEVATILLSYDISLANERVEESYQHRKPSWKTYLQKQVPDGNFREYYGKQVLNYHKLLTYSTLPTLCIDSTHIVKATKKILDQSIRAFMPYPLTAAGSLIFDAQNKLFLMQSSGKYGSEWIVPGGKVAYHENVVDALKREIFEETNIKLDAIDFIGYRDYFTDTKHFIFLEFSAFALNPGEVRINEEAKSFGWFTKEELKTLQIAAPTQELIQQYYDRTKL